MYTISSECKNMSKSWGKYWGNTDSILKGESKFLKNPGICYYLFQVWLGSFHGGCYATKGLYIIYWPTMWGPISFAPI